MHKIYWRYATTGKLSLDIKNVSSIKNLSKITRSSRCLAWYGQAVFGSEIKWYRERTGWSGLSRPNFALIIK